MEKIKNLDGIAQIVKKYNLSPTKSLGQNFLFDLNITAQIAKIAGKLDTSTIIEIGAGPGGLTRSLFMEGANRIIVIEKDSRAINALREIQTASDGKLEIINCDAMTVDMEKLKNEFLPTQIEKPLQIIANLPYNIATKLLMKWLETPNLFAKLTLMFQREVALRITAKVGDKNYSRLSVICNQLCQSEIRLNLDANVFWPVPKVKSSVVCLTPRTKPLHNCNTKHLITVVKAAFCQRRKMLRSSLKTLNMDTTKLLNHSKIDGTKRAEQLSLGEFAKLAIAYEKMLKDRIYC